MINRYFNFFFLALCVLAFSSCGYKKLVVHEEEVSKAWSDQENLNQERIDKASQLLESFAGNSLIKPYQIKRMQDSLAISKHIMITASPIHLSQENVTVFENALTGLQEETDSFIKVIEMIPGLVADPELKSIKKDLKILDNKINASTLAYNEAALKYNSSRQSPWKFLLVNIVGFKAKGYFQKVRMRK